MTHEIRRLDHVNVAMPAGREPDADTFYRDLLGFGVKEKPPGAPGRWFKATNFEIHLGVDPDFRPAKTAHPAIVVEHLDALAERLVEAGVDVVWDDVPPVHRCVVHDPFGNRVELIDS